VHNIVRAIRDRIGNCDLRSVAERKSQFPILSLIALTILCTSASSAQPERDFSSVEYTVTETKSRLSAK